MQKQRSNTFAKLWKNRMMYLMLLPVIAYLIIFCYIPMVGIVIGFEDFIPKLGMFQSQWVGLQNFKILFGGVKFPAVVKNTIVLSVLRYIFEFPAPIILALLLNEVTHTGLKRVVQTAVYMPHFLSWIISASLVLMVVDGDGIIVRIMSLFGYKGNSSLMMSVPAFYPIILVSSIWKGVGWGTLIYLAAIAGVDPELYDSAILDGASRLQQCFYITIPEISSTIVVLMILRTGSILNAGFDQVFNLQNVINLEVSEIIDTYVYKVGIRDGMYSISTVVSLFKSVIGMILILSTNAIARRLGESSLL